MDSFSTSRDAADAELILHRRRLLEVGRADVNELLKDISEKYSSAIYYRDLEIGQMRGAIVKLQAELEEARSALRAADDGRARVESTVADLQRELSSASAAITAQRTSAQDMSSRFDQAVAEKVSTIAKLEEKARKSKQVRKEAAGLAEEEIAKLHREMSILKDKVGAAAALASDEKKRSDHYYKCLKGSEQESEELINKMHRISSDVHDRQQSREFLEETLRLQLLNTKRLLSVIAYFGTAEGASQAHAIAKGLHAIASGGYQFVGGSSLTAPATVIQDMQQAVLSFSEAEAAATKRLLPTTYKNSVEPYRSMHVEKDQWVPTEALAVVRHFQQKYFPNAKPDLFYNLLLQVGCTIRDLCNMSPVDNLLRRVHKHEEATLKRYGLHNNVLNAPQTIPSGPSSATVNKGASLDYGKKSYPQFTKGHYYSEQPIKGSTLTAHEEYRLGALADALQGVLLLRRNIAHHPQHTVVTLTAATVEEVCGTAAAALEEAAAQVKVRAQQRNVAAAPHSAVEGNELSIVLSHLNALFGVVQEGSSKGLQLLKGITDSATHLKDAMRVMVADIEKSRRSTVTGSSNASELSGPYAVLKALVSQAVDRYTTEITHIARAAESNSLSTREASTQHYHTALAKAKLSLGPL